MVTLINLLIVVASLSMTFIRPADASELIEQRWVLCRISQGDKGTYVTFAKYVSETKNMVLISTSSQTLVESQPMLVISIVPKKRCKQVN